MNNKKWNIILTIAFSLLTMAISPLEVFAAQDDSATAKNRPQMEGALVIVAPRLVQVGQEISLGVILRQTQEPVAGVSVWGITRGAAATLTNDMSALKEKGTDLTESDYEAVLDDRAFRIGKTDDNGKLFYTFQETGNFVLIAFKAHYWPNIAGIAVREKPNVLPKLAIKAPRLSPPGEAITISVSQKNNGEPVKDAAVWALTREQAEALRIIITEAREANQLQTTDWEAELKSLSAIFLGATNGSGDLKYTFEETRVYLLVALKPGFLPGRASIAIGDSPRILSIQAPKKAIVGESVNIAVLLRNNGEAVKDAAIWAIGRDKVSALREEVAEIKVSGDLQNADWESVLGLYGTKLGETNGNGELQADFADAGGYLMVAVKKGNIPGFARIMIVEEQITDQSNAEPNE